MSAITAVTFDKPSYAPGDEVTMTVEGTWEQADQITVTTPDGATGTGTLEVAEPLTVTDASGRKWDQVSDNGTQAVYTATA